MPANPFPFGMDLFLTNLDQFFAGHAVRRLCPERKYQDALQPARTARDDALSISLEHQVDEVCRQDPFLFGMDLLSRTCRTPSSARTCSSPALTRSSQTRHPAATP